jgi:glycosyltransferase involved in cell wall biosynthesis
LRTVVPYEIRVNIRKLLSAGEDFLPDLHSTPEILERRYHLFREAALSSQRLMTPSNFMKRTFVRNGYPEDAIEVVPLGLENTRLPLSGPEYSSDSLTFGFIGSLVPLKGVDVLIRAFRKLEGNHIRLLLYGRSDIVPRYDRRLRRLARGDFRLSFMGPFSPEDKDDVYSKIDVLVVPSLAHESFSLVTREALQRKRPVIASALGALPEIVYDNVNGFLVEPGNVEALRENMQRLASDPSLLKSLQVPGPVEILSVAEHVELIEDIYSEVCSGQL